MRFYRVKQIGENRFIPQVRKWYELFYNGIGVEDNNAFNLWVFDISQEAFCPVSTLKQAQQIIEDYKIYLKKDSKYPKYLKSK